MYKRQARRSKRKWSDEIPSGKRFVSSTSFSTGRSVRSDQSLQQRSTLIKRDKTSPLICHRHSLNSKNARVTQAQWTTINLSSDWWKENIKLISKEWRTLYITEIRLTSSNRIDSRRCCSFHLRKEKTTLVDFAFSDGLIGKCAEMFVRSRWEMDSVNCRYFPLHFLFLRSMMCYFRNAKTTFFFSRSLFLNQQHEFCSIQVSINVASAWENVERKARKERNHSWAKNNGCISSLLLIFLLLVLLRSSVKVDVMAR